MSDEEKLPSLSALQEKIDSIKDKENYKEKSGKGSDLSQAMRLSIDLVAGVAVGLGVGYFLDNFLATMPLFMIIGLFIGMAAGVKNMLRSAEIIDKKLK